MHRRPRCASLCVDADAPAASLRIAGLHSGATIARAPNALAAPTISLRALGSDEAVTWLIDGRLVGRSVGNAPIELTLEDAGEKQLVAIDARGRYARLALRVTD
jgi:penicillin-binding protein 1C